MNYRSTLPRPVGNPKSRDCSPWNPVGLAAALSPAGALHNENPMTIGIIDLILAAAIIAIVLSRREW